MHYLRLPKANEYMGPVEQRIRAAYHHRQPLLAWLIDPDVFSEAMETTLQQVAQREWVDLILVGGSLLHRVETDRVVRQIKTKTSTPVLLFPGSAFQLSGRVDAVLFLVLLSGRNPEYLIGKHVEAAPFIERHGLEVIPTSYLLIEGGRISSAQYVSGTIPLPKDRPQLAAVTALAGRYMGQRLVYLDAGSGACEPVSPDIIAAVQRRVPLPLIVGGGIRTPQQARAAWIAGATVVAVGNQLEVTPSLIQQLAHVRNTI